MARPSPALGTIDTAPLGSDIVVTRMTGHVTRELAEARSAQFRAHLVGLRAPRWLLDLSGLARFDAGAIAEGGSWFQLFRAQEGTVIVLVSGMSGARMAAATLAFSVGLNVTVCSTLDEAIEQLSARAERW